MPERNTVIDSKLTTSAMFKNKIFFSTQYEIYCYRRQEAKMTEKFKKEIHLKISKCKELVQYPAG